MPCAEVKYLYLSIFNLHANLCCSNEMVEVIEVNMITFHKFVFIIELSYNSFFNIMNCIIIEYLLI